ncbi:EF-hand domain-containing protein [Streptomyces sp. NPDC048370]|uniref:EF-hand domain-containing protein n=1 Tax=Streptomyces sp. NPDC048370 TaxID=3365540 RepID=UPI003714F5B8
MTAVQERKLQRHFELLDLDQNGFIEQADLAEFAGRINDAAGARDSREGMALIAEADRVWQALQKALDTDGDQRISREEFISAGDIDHVMNEAIKLGKMSFDVVDSDHDGRISLDEWIRMDQKLGVARPESTKGFQQLDMDGDGFVTKSEYAKGVEDFYRSDDPQAPGNWAFGAF